MSENFKNTTAHESVQEEEQQSIKLADIWEIIWNNRIWFILSILLCLMLAGFHLYRTQKSYSRVAKVIVDESAENSTMRDLTAFAGGMSRYRYQSGTNVYNEIEALASPDLMVKVVERLHLENIYVEKQLFRTREKYQNSPVELQLAGENAQAFSFNLIKTGDETFTIKDLKISGEDGVKHEKIDGAIGDTLVTPAGKIVIVPTVNIAEWKNDIAVTHASPKRLSKSYAARLGVSLSGKESSVVVLSFTDRFPSRAESVISTLVSVYNESWIENKNRAAKYTTRFINERLNVIEQDLGGVEADLKDYKARNQITDIDEVAKVYLDQSSEYAAKQFELNTQIENAKLVKSYLEDPANSDKLIPANSNVPNTEIGSSIVKYNDGMLQRNKLLQESSPSNPNVVYITEALAQLRSSIISSISNLITTLNNQKNRVMAQEREVLSRMSSTSGQALQIQSIARQQKVKEQLYIYLLQKREENEIAAMVNVGNTRMIVMPDGTTSPVAPKSKTVLLLALILGFGLPFVIFFIMYQLDTKVKGRGDIADLSIPFLAEIPQKGIKGNWFQRRRINRLDESNTQIFVKPGSRNSINEAFRVLRTNLDLMTARHEGCNKIMVTSFNPDSGKTFVIMNMARSMSLKGVPVLLLDLDMRKATLSKKLDKNNEGIAAFLSGKTDDIESLIQQVADNLYIISVGTLPPNPAELLASSRFAEMMDRISSKFRYIFVDCPPVEIVADTAIIAQQVDMTIFIIRAGMFDKRALPYIESLNNSGNYNRMTIVLNGVEPRSTGYGYGYGYGYGRYGYGRYGYGRYGYGKYGKYGNYGSSDDSSDDE